MANPIKASDLYQDDGSILQAIQQLQALAEEHGKVLAGVKKEAIGLTANVKTLNATTGKQREEISAAAKQADELAKKYEKYNISLTKNAQDIAAVNEAQVKLNQVNKAEARLNMAKEGSYNALSAQYTLLKLRINQLSLAERENTKEGQGMVQQSKEIYIEMKRLQEETGKTSLNVGNYKESIKEALQETGLFPGALGQVIRQLTSIQRAMTASAAAIGGGSKALRIFKIALAATGVGLILVALGSLVAFLTRTQEGIDKVNRVLAGFKAVADVFIDRLSAIGKALTDDFTGNMEKAGKATVSFFGKLFRRDFAGLAADFGVVADGLKDLKDEIVDEFDAATQLTGALQAVRRETQDLEVASARARAEIKRLNMVSEDTTQGYAERSAAAAKAGEIERGLLQQKEALLQRELNAIVALKEQGNSLFADDQEVADKRREIAQTQMESLELQTTIQNKLNTINREAIGIANELNAAFAETAAILGGPAAAARLEYDMAIGKIDELRAKARLLGKEFNEQFAEMELIAGARLSRGMDALLLSTQALALEGMKPLAASTAGARDELGEVSAIAGKVAEQSTKLKSNTKLTKDEVGALKGAFGEAKQQLSGYFDEAAALADFQLQQAQQGVQAAQNELQIQLQLAAAGYADRVEGAQDELALARQTQAKAERQRQRAQRAQLVGQSVEQASNLVTAISMLFAQLPFFLALPASAVLFGTFTAAKVKAFQATRFKEGGYEVLEGGSHSSGHDIPLGFDSKGRQRRAEGGEGMAIFSRKALARYGGMLPSLVAAINRGEFERKYSALTTATESLAPGGTVVNVSTAGVEDRLDALRRDGQRRTWQDGKGRTVEQVGNRKITYV